MDCPLKTWESISTNYWSNIEKYLATQKTDSLLIVQSGQIIYSYGDTTKKLLIHSCRKSILNAIIISAD